MADEPSITNGRQSYNQEIQVVNTGYVINWFVIRDHSFHRARNFEPSRGIFKFLRNFVQTGDKGTNTAYVRRLRWP